MKKAEDVCKILRKEYGTYEFECDGAIGTLVHTILSQNTSDLNSGRAYAKLKNKFPSWKKVMDADVRSIESAIRIGGLPKIKAKRIKEALRKIQKERGKLDISFLKNISEEEGMKWLTSFDGIGPKTAAIVLMFCFGKNTMAVDTHIFRVTKRIGLIPKRCDRVKAQEILNKEIPNKCKMNCHVNIIELGRKVCKPKNPKCDLCCLNKLCDSAFSF